MKNSIKLPSYEQQEQQMRKQLGDKAFYEVRIRQLKSTNRMYVIMLSVLTVCALLVLVAKIVIKAPFGILHIIAIVFTIGSILLNIYSSRANNKRIREYSEALYHCNLSNLKEMENQTEKDIQPVNEDVETCKKLDDVPNKKK